MSPIEVKNAELVETSAVAETNEVEEVSPEIKAMQDELNSLEVNDPEEYLEKANAVLERHSFKDVFKVFSAMYADATLFMGTEAASKPELADNVAISAMIKDSFDMEQLCAIYKSEKLVSHRNDNAYFSTKNIKREEKKSGKTRVTKPTTGVYERLDKLFRRSSEKFPRIPTLKNFEIVPDTTKNIWRHLAMALDAIITRDGWPTRARYVKQVMINANLVGIFFRNGGSKLFEDIEDHTFDCMKAILEGIKKFNTTVLDEIASEQDSQ